jgi:hypothetical protein
MLITMWLLIRTCCWNIYPNRYGGNEGQNCIATAQVTITQPEILVSVSGIATNATCLVKLKLMDRLL